MKPIKVLLVDDHIMIRDVLKSYLAEDRFNVDEASHGQEALQMYSQGNYDLVITDIDMPHMDGISLTEEIRKLNKDQTILVLTMIIDSTYVRRMLKAGVSGYLSKDSDKEEILEAIDVVLSGDNYYSRQITKTIMDNLSSKQATRSNVVYEMPLSEREKEVLHLITKEYSNQEIADKLFISVRTVDAHKRNLLDKTGAKNVAGLVIYAIERQVFDDIF